MITASVMAWQNEIPLDCHRIKIWQLHLMLMKDDNNKILKTFLSNSSLYSEVFSVCLLLCHNVIFA